MPRRFLRLTRPLAALGVAAGLTVGLAQHTTSAAFTATTGDTGNSVTAATSFCASPGGTTLTASADTTTYQQSPTTAYGSSVDIGVGSYTGGNGRMLVKFTLPALGAHCVVTAGTLRLYAHNPETGRTIDVYRVDPAAPAWSEATTHWNNQPTTTGTAVGTSSLVSAGWQQWTVTSMVSTFYSGTNSGFYLRDRTESSGSALWQLYASRENATTAQRPQLVLTWG